MKKIFVPNLDLVDFLGGNLKSTTDIGNDIDCFKIQKPESIQPIHNLIFQSLYYIIALEFRYFKL